MRGFQNWIKFYKSSSDAVAAIEAAFIFPLLLTLILGTLDLGRGIMSNQKTIKASQIVADLITRDTIVNNAMINEAITAGTLAILPYDDENLEIEIVSVRFLDDGTPQIVWREPEAGPMILDNSNIAERVMPLSAPGEGVVVVAAQYKYEPIFASIVVDEIPMLEVAFARGRKGPVVCREGAPTC